MKASSADLAGRPLQPMRILYVYASRGEAYGGTLVDLLQVIDRLDRNQFEPLVLLSLGETSARWFHERGIRTVHFPLPPFRKAKSFPRLPFVLFNLCVLLKTNRIDLVHVNSVYDVAIFTIVCRLRGIPCLAHVRRETEPQKFRMRWLHRADLVIAVSRQIQEAAIVGGVSSGHVRLLPSGIEVRQVDGRGIRSKYGLEGKIVIGSVAATGKGMDTFIEGLGLLCRNRLDIVGLWVGSQGSITCQQRVRELGLADRIIFAGFQSDVLPFIAAMDIFALLSREEAFGLVLLEGMSQGKPIIATRTAGAVDIVLDEQTGILVPVGDATAFSTAVTRLIYDPEFARKLGEAGFQRVCSSFSLDASIRALTRLYESVRKS